MQAPFLPESRFAERAKELEEIPRQAVERKEREERDVQQWYRSRKKGTHKNMKKDSDWLLKQRQKKAKVRTGKEHKQIYKNINRDMYKEMYRLTQSPRGQEKEREVHKQIHNSSKRDMHKEMCNPRLKQSTMLKLNPRLEVRTGKR